MPSPDGNMFKHVNYKKSWGGIFNSMKRYYNKALHNLSRIITRKRELLYLELNHVDQIHQEPQLPD